MIQVQYRCTRTLVSQIKFNLNDDRRQTVSQNSIRTKLPLPFQRYQNASSYSHYKSTHQHHFRQNNLNTRSCRSVITTASSIYPLPITSPIPLWTILATCAALSQLIEKRTSLGTLLSAPLLATLTALVCSAIGIIPSSHSIFDHIWTYIMPLSTALYLLQSDLSKLFSSQTAMSIIAFVNGSVGTVLGTIIAYKSVGFFLGTEGSKIAAALCASYIGGSVNFAAVAGLLGLKSGATLGAAMTADNMAMALYIAVLMSIPVSQRDIHRITTMKTNINNSNTSNTNTNNTEQQPSAESIGMAIAAALLACSLGNTTAAYLGIQSGGLAFTALFASIIAACTGYCRRIVVVQSKQTTAIGNNNSSNNIEDNNNSSGNMIFQGAEALGGALMMFFFATIGATAGNIQAFFSQQNLVWLFLFIIIQLSIQITVALSLGKLMKIPLPIVLITANANVGGPGTAVAMTTVKQWPLVQDAVLTGSLGYAMANIIGYGMGMWMQSWYSF